MKSAASFAVMLWPSLDRAFVIVLFLFPPFLLTPFSIPTHSECVYACACFLFRRALFRCYEQIWYCFLLSVYNHWFVSLCSRHPWQYG